MYLWVTVLWTQPKETEDIWHQKRKNKQVYSGKIKRLQWIKKTGMTKTMIFNGLWWMLNILINIITDLWYFPFLSLWVGYGKIHHLFLTKCIYQYFKSVLSAFNDFICMSPLFLISLNTDTFWRSHGILWIGFHRENE